MLTSGAWYGTALKGGTDSVKALQVSRKTNEYFHSNKICIILGDLGPIWETRSDFLDFTDFRWFNPNFNPQPLKSKILDVFRGLGLKT